MRNRKIAFVLLLTALAVLWPGRNSMPQPLIPKEKIPKEIRGDVREMIENLYHPNPQWRIGAASVLGQMGVHAAPAVPFLVAILSDNAALGYATPGKEAAESLVKIGDPAVEAVIGVFQDTDTPGGCGRRRRRFWGGSRTRVPWGR